MTTPIRSAALRLLTAVALASSFILATAPARATTDTCRPHGRDLSITFQPIDHTVADAQYVLTRLTLADHGRCALGHDWALYFNAVRRPAALIGGTAGQTAQKQLADQGLSVAHADAAQSGDLFVLRPTSAFKPVAPGERRAIAMNYELWMIQKTDAPAGWSIAVGGAPAEWVPAKALLDPADPKQTTAFSGDKRPVESAATRFADDTAPRIDLSLRQRLVPQPLSAVAGHGSVTLDGRTRIENPAALASEASYLRSALGDLVAPGRGGGGTVVRLSVDPKLDVDHDGRPDAEGYTLRTAGRTVGIVGADAAGVLYGVQTLRQLVPASAYAAAARGARPPRVAVPAATIADAPLFGYRGLGIDTARHFMSRRTVEKFLDLMSFLKMNRLHFHLTDDEGWRLQIPGLPELTGFGGRRGLDLAEKTRLHQAMGSGDGLKPDDGVTAKAKNETQANLGTKPAYQGFEQDTVNFAGSGSGYYTTADFEEILRYAEQRHIQVIPEFDMPAHARAAVQSMERRYQRTGDATYRLIDPKDTSQHTSVQGYTDNLVNPCVPGTYRFLTKVVTEVKAMYARAGAPLGTINLGGDEAPGPDRWQGSPACEANPQTAGKDDAALMNYFFTKWNGIALTAAPRTAGWEDIIRDDPRTLKLDHFIALPWQNVWGWGREDWAYHFANNGQPVVLAHATNLYMDLAYNKDPDEPGYYWANYVDEKATFTYQPFDVYADATQDRWGNPIAPNPNWERLTPEGRKNILGMEANLWAENGKTPQLREYQAFPKLLGVAERAWNRDTPTPARMPAAWNVFDNTLGQVTFPLLSFYRPVGLSGAGSGVNYRIPLPGGQVEGGTLTANVRDPGMAVEYSTDGVAWKRYSGPVATTPTVLLRTRAADGRTSRISPVGLRVWNAATAYPAGALVDHQGEIYRATRAGTGAAPDVSPGSWALVR